MVLSSGLIFYWTMKRVGAQDIRYKFSLVRLIDIKKLRKLKVLEPSVLLTPLCRKYFQELFLLILFIHKRNPSANQSIQYLITMIKI